MVMIDLHSEGECSENSENCSSCEDETCMFHEKNYDEEKLIRLINEKLINESLKRQIIRK